MVNCFKTQFLGVINNDNLPIFETLKLKVTSKTITDVKQQKLSIKAAAPVQVTTRGGSFGVGSVDNIVEQPYTIPADTSNATDLFFSNGNYTVEIKGKYDLYSLELPGVVDSIISFNLNEVSYIIGLTSLVIKYMDCSGSLKQLSKLTALTRLSVQGTNIRGDIKDLNGITGLTNLYCADCNNIYGNLSDISELENLQTLSFSNTCLVGSTADLGASRSLTTVYTNTSSLSGSVEEYVAAQISAGILSRNVSNFAFISNLLNFATFGGNKYRGNYCCVTFENANKIAVYVGDSTPAACHSAYVLGYGTQEEAEAAIPGKTIIRVDA